MKRSSFFWGFFLFGLGSLLLLNKMNYLYIWWDSILGLWPFILILVGITLLPLNRFIKIGLGLLWIAGTIFYVSKADAYTHHWFDFRPWDDDESTWYDQTDKTSFIAMDSTLTNAVLELDAAAGNYEIYGTTSHLLFLSQEGTVAPFSLRNDTAGNSAVIKISMKGKHFKTKKNKYRNESVIQLNENPVWDLNLEVGAATVDFDLSPFKVGRIDLDGGATSVKIRLGDKSPRTDVDIETGASSVDIEVPLNTGCEVKTSTVLTDKSLEGFEKISTGLYRTPGFDADSNRIFINVDAAMASIKVRRY